MLLQQLVLLTSVFTLLRAQRTEGNAGTCTYTFVVPSDPDIVSTCQSYSNQQVQMLQKKMLSLQAKVDALQSEAGHSRTGVHQGPNPLNPSFSCNCNANTTFSFSYTDCQDVKRLADGPSGVYEITPVRSTGQLLSLKAAKSDETPEANQKYWVATTWDPVRVTCDLDDELIGWTVIMKRRAMNVRFNRTWNEYRNGFGDLEDGGDFWLGLEHVHRLTTQRYTKYALWVVISDVNNVPHVMPYSHFQVDDESTDYTLQIGGWQGKVTERLMESNGHPFVAGIHRKEARDVTTLHTYQSYNTDPSLCVNSTRDTGGGGWWFPNYGVYCGPQTYNSECVCGNANLNGWKPYWSGIEGIKAVEMKIRQVE